MPGSSSTAHSTAHNSTASTPSTEKLDRNSTARQPSTPRRMESALTGSTGPRQARQARPRQPLDNGLDSGSTEPRQLDSSTARAQPRSDLRPGHAPNQVTAGESRDETSLIRLHPQSSVCSYTSHHQSTVTSGSHSHTSWPPMPHARMPPRPPC